MSLDLTDNLGRFSEFVQKKEDTKLSLTCQDRFYKTFLKILRKFKECLKKYTVINPSYA